MKNTISMYELPELDTMQINESEIYNVDFPFPNYNVKIFIKLEDPTIEKNTLLNLTNSFKTENSNNLVKSLVSLIKDENCGDMWK